MKFDTGRVEPLGGLDQTVLPFGYEVVKDSVHSLNFWLGNLQKRKFGLYQVIWCTLGSRQLMASARCYLFINH